MKIIRNSDNIKKVKFNYYLLCAVLFFLVQETAYASFVLSGTTITQSGTDTDLTGLSGITGVTVIESGTGSGIRRVYLLPDATNLLITGTLTIDPELEEIILAEDAPTNGFMVSGTGTLNISGKRTVNSFDFYSTRRWLTVPRDENFPTNGIRFQDSSTINWEGGEAFFRSGLIIDDGANLTITNGIIDGGGSTTGGNQVRNSSTALDVNGLVAKRHAWTHLAIPTRFDGYEAVQAAQAHGWSAVSPNETVPLRDFFGGQGNDKDVAFWSGTRIELINSVTGTDLIVGPNNSGNNTSYGFVHVKKEVVIDPKTSAGASIDDVTVFVRDTDNGNRETYNREGYVLDASVDKTYTATTTGGAGTPTMTIDTGFNIVNDGNGDANNTGAYAWDFRGKNNNNTDLFDFHLWGYLNNYTSIETDLKGAGVKTINPILFSDTNITETNKATVDAYATIDNLDQFYDRAKSWKINSTNIEYPTVSTQLVIANSGTLDFGSRNLVIDKTATSTFAVNTTTHTITIKADALAVGTKFTEIQTTGSITFSNGAVAELGYSHSGGRVKYIEVRGLTSSNVELVDNVPTTPVILVNAISLNGTYKATFNAPADETNTRLNVTRLGYSSFAQLFSSNSLSLIVEPLLLSNGGLEAGQAAIIFNLLKVLQKTEAIKNGLENASNPTLSITEIANTATGQATEGNQTKMLNLLRRILTKVTAIREVHKP